MIDQLIKSRCYQNDPAIRRVLDALVDGRFAEDRESFRAIHNMLLANGDYYMHLADFGAYAVAQAKASELYRDPGLWARKAILNVARSGKFSSDRTIQQYATESSGISPPRSSDGRDGISLRHSPYTFSR